MAETCRIAVFIDGGYFNTISNYYKHNHPVASRISINGLMDFIRAAVAHLEDVPAQRCLIVEAHYFRGRFSLRDLEARAREEGFVERALRNDRAFDQVLAAANVTAHYTRVDTRGEVPKEQGIDVWMAIEAFDVAVQGRCDVVVLLTGDGDFLPLIRKINAIGRRTMLLGWRVRDEVQSVDIRCSEVAMDGATYAVEMAQMIEDPTDEAEARLVDNLFVEARDGH
jgi:uncharacterized LabA/DUF88 family protein